MIQPQREVRGFGGKLPLRLYLSYILLHLILRRRVPGVVLKLVGCSLGKRVEKPQGKKSTYRPPWRFVPS